MFSAVGVGINVVLMSSYFTVFFNSTIPDWLVWLKYLSWFNYAFEVLVVNQWDGYGNIS